MKDAYIIPRIDENLSKLGDAKFFTTDLGSAFGRYHSGSRTGTRQGLPVSWVCFNGNGCRLDLAMSQPRFSG